MTHQCDICKAPAGYRYRGHWNCKTCFERRRAIFTAFDRICKTPGKCGRDILPSLCLECGFNLDVFRQKKSQP